MEDVSILVNPHFVKSEVDKSAYKNTIKKEKNL